jgi:hypothetical protein
VQARWPTFGARIQRRDLAVGQPECHRAVQKLAGLLRMKAQIVGADVELPALGTQAGQRNGRNLPWSGHAMKLRGQVVESGEGRGLAWASA